MVIDAATLMRALLDAGFDYRRYAHGGADFQKRFLLTERGERLEVIGAVKFSPVIVGIVGVIAVGY